MLFITANFSPNFHDLCKKFVNTENCRTSKERVRCFCFWLLCIKRDMEDNPDQRMFHLIITDSKIYQYVLTLWFLTFYSWKITYSHVYLKVLVKV